MALAESPGSMVYNVTLSRWGHASSSVRGVHCLDLAQRPSSLVFIVKNSMWCAYLTVYPLFCLLGICHSIEALFVVVDE